MKRKLCGLALLNSIFLAGCLAGTSTIEPIYDSENITIDDRIIGSWIDPNEKDSLIVISKKDATSYFVAMDKSVYTVSLTKIGENLYIDAVNDKAGEDDLEMGVHTFYKIVINTDELVFSQIDHSALKAAVQSTPFVEVDSYSILLTAPTLDLRKFLAAPETQPMFKETVRLKKK